MAIANTYDTVTKVTCVDSKSCPAKIQKKERKCINFEIRPLVRLYRKSSPSPPPPTQLAYRKESTPPCQNPRETKKENPRKTDLPVNQPKISQNETCKATSIFFTSTALFTPAKPSYENFSKYGGSRYKLKSAGSSLFSSYNLTARARSEFRERSSGRRSYVSLY